MDVALDRGGKDARFAVMRNYQPARIEHELLAQVFNIVQGNEAKLASKPDHAELPALPSSTPAIDDDSMGRTYDRVTDNQRVELEPAA